MSITLPTSRSSSTSTRGRTRSLALTFILPLALLAACGDDDTSADGGRVEDSGAVTEDGGGEDSGAGGDDTGVSRFDAVGFDAGCEPTIEICGDRIDQNCDGRDTSCGDSDNDRVEACRVGDDLSTCDCDDDSADVYPGRAEMCDGLDNDCNGRIDEISECCAGCSDVGQRGDLCAVSGECECSTAPGRAVCGEGQVCCGNGCSDISSDISNCGFCGTACDTSTDRCTAGQCRCGADESCANDRMCTAGSCG